MKNSPKQLSKRNRPASLPEDGPNLRRRGEQMMADLQRVLEGHDFASVEEVNAFLATLPGKELDQAVHDLPPPSPREHAQMIAATKRGSD